MLGACYLPLFVTILVYFVCTIITTPVTWVVNLYTYEAQQEEYVQYNYASCKLISRLQSSEYSHIN